MAAFPITIKTFSQTGFVDLGTTTVVALQAVAVGARPPSIIQPIGVIRPRQSMYTAAKKQFTVRNTASDLGGYRKLILSETYRSLVDVSETFPNVEENIPETIAIEEFATDVNVMYGITCDGLTAREIDVEAYKDPLGTLEDVTIIQQVYKRSADGTEELLAENESGLLTTSYATYTFSPSIAARWSASGDRLVVKYLGVNYGEPLPP